ncbi:hypothetical protein I546_4068 [Mycobacterium kansasii 732]|nr:hypothetical protein I546_4068 [Mycobacterium kansasii 732]
MNGALSALGSGLVQTGGTLAGGLGAGLSGLIGTGQLLAGSFGAGASGLLQTGEALAAIWENAAAQIGGALGGAVEATFGVGFPGCPKSV